MHRTFYSCATVDDEYGYLKKKKQQDSVAIKSKQSVTQVINAPLIFYCIGEFCVNVL